MSPGLVAVVKPASATAVAEGHPEEALGGALAVAAVVLAHRRHAMAAAVAFGLALATKQWAVLVLPPLIIATPAAQRRRLLTLGVGVFALATLPQLIANPGGYLATTRAVSNGGNRLGGELAVFCLDTRARSSGAPSWVPEVP